jgi:holin-like protein
MGTVAALCFAGVLHSSMHPAAIATTASSPPPHLTAPRPIVVWERVMIGQLLLIMSFQLAGEAAVALTGLNFPGPLCGLLLMLAWLALSGGPSEELSRAAGTLVDHLGLLFVPAGAAIIGFGTLLLSDGMAIAGALLLSTGFAIAVAGLLGGAPSAQSLHKRPE